MLGCNTKPSFGSRKLSISPFACSASLRAVTGTLNWGVRNIVITGQLLLMWFHWAFLDLNFISLRRKWPAFGMGSYSVGAALHMAGYLAWQASVQQMPVHSPNPVKPSDDPPAIHTLPGAPQMGRKDPTFSGEPHVITKLPASSQLSPSLWIINPFWGNQPPC